jgi:DNA-binding NarL/FixJ family response regulator
LEDWNGRLIHRKLVELTPARVAEEFSARIVHAGEGWYFPLGTSNESLAASRAGRIHQTVVAKGWECAHRRFPRELTLALRWLDNPVAWTYITIHTQPGSDVSSRSGRLAAPASAFRVALVEPEPGLRRALAACVNAQAGFKCDLGCAGVAEAVRETSRLPLDFALVNHAVANQAGVAGLEEWQRANPGLVCLWHSTFEDSDQLFKATPGGALGYLLKRTAPSRVFEPIAGVVRPLTHEQVASHVRSYFQRLSASLPSGPPSRELAALTPREHEVLGLLSKGQLAKEIAETLGISAWTVHGHVKSIFEKLNVHTRTEAVVKFLQK